jgi:hypothetical protein
VLIGTHWLTSTDSSGSRRIDDPDDFIRIEVETALVQSKIVVPVLINGARMPHSEDLPSGLASLLRRQALEVSSQSLASDLERLVEILKRSFKSR